MDMDFQSSSSSEGEYIEPEETFKIKCLFCDFYSLHNNHDKIFEHISNIHSINFLEQCKKHNLDVLDFLKLVNYLRLNSDASSFEYILENKLFKSEDYLKPTFPDDHFLIFDYESEIQEMKKLNIISENEINYQDFSKEELIQIIMNLKNLNNENNVCMERMRSLLTMDDNKQNENIHITNLNEKSDYDYINSYSHFSVHHMMLADKPRTLAYQDAILENSSFFKDKTVLDIGCGVGILSLFAAKAGAKIVVAVDQSDIIYNAQSIIHQNGFNDKIKIVKGKLEELNFENSNLPTKYDIIISEWMGYFLFFEVMIETILFARNKLLKIDGVFLPNRCKLFLSAFSDCKFYENNIDFWNDVYGFNMSSMIDDVTNEAIIDLINPENICSTAEKICDFNIITCPNNFINEISSKFELKFKNNSTVHGFVGWFDCYFESMSKLIILSTSPFSEITHWKQTIFPLKEPILVKGGQTISGEIKIQKNKKNPRSLKIEIILKEENLKLNYNIC